MYAARVSATRSHRPTRACALLLALAPLACATPASYGVRGHYQHPEAALASAPAPLLVSAHISRFGVEREPAQMAAPDTDTGVSGPPRMLEGSEISEDRILLVFGQELDPLTIDPRAFAISRGDGRRVRPTRAFLAPADESDENRSLTLTGNFGGADSLPVAIHVIGELFTEAGLPLQGLGAEISGPAEPDRPLHIERLEPSTSRCPTARQVIRTYWSDTLSEVGDDDLAQIELRLADGRVITPIGFDDQAQRVGDEQLPGLGRADDNVLDLCVDAEQAVLHVRFAAGVFTDANNTPTAAADLSLAAPPTPAS